MGDWASVMMSSSSAPRSLLLCSVAFTFLTGDIINRISSEAAEQLNINVVAVCPKINLTKTYQNQRGPLRHHGGELYAAKSHTVHSKFLVSF